MGMIDAADQGLVNPTLARKQWVTSRFDVCPICVPLSGVTVGIKNPSEDRDKHHRSPELPLHNQNAA